MTKKPETNQQIWIAIFLVLPLILLSRLGNNFTDNSFNQILFAGVFGLVGAVLGGAVFQLIKTKTTVTKIISLLLLIALCIGTLLVVEKLNKPTLQSCEICGYDAIEITKNKCDYCENIPYDQKKIKGYKDKQEWLKEEQLFWFSLDSASQKVDFFNPAVDEGFIKDKNWKPSITQQELIDDFNESP